MDILGEEHAGLCLLHPFWRGMWKHQASSCLLIDVTVVGGVDLPAAVGSSDHSTVAVQP